MTDAAAPRYDVVVPTLGRPQLAALLAALDRQAVPRPQRIVLVDDRPAQNGRLDPPVPPGIASLVRVVASGGRGPAAARNVGWRATSSEWVVFLDDDVIPGPRWGAELAHDLAGAAAEVAGIQGRISVPLPANRAPTDWERNVAGLAGARWITADMAYRRDILELVGGFDERFPRAYREDSDLALRVLRSGLGLEVGRRHTVHPVRPSRPLDSVRRQAGNADDVMMAVLHGRGWRSAAGAPQGRRLWHLATVAAAVVALEAGMRRRRTARAAATVWALLTAGFTWRRLRGGPWTPAEIATMLVTSAAIPPAAIGHWTIGWLRIPGALRHGPRLQGPGDASCVPVEAVLFDRDGTLVLDVPYNGDPAAVEPVPGAAEALDALRARGVRIGMISNQSGIGRGLLTAEQVDAVNRRVESLLGPFDVVVVCPHHPDDGCGCRKPRPGMVVEAARRLGVDTDHCVVVGDIGSDVQAGRRAGARSVLVPTPVTLPAEVAAAPHVAADLAAVVDLLAPSLVSVA